VSNDRTAKVVECFGRRAIVQLPDGTRSAASVFGKRMEVLCGDDVQLRQSPNDLSQQIVAVLPRRSSIARTDSRGRTELLVANVTLLAVVAASEPAPDLYMIDRYLAGAAYAGLRTLVILNKSDLTDEDVLIEYRQAGYQTLNVSAETGAGIEALRAQLEGEVFLLVGQSGVGKSTITNALIPSSLRRTRELSTSSGEGKHTTVSAALFDLPLGGALIDSPGVRDYAPPPIDDNKIQVGWPEILALAPQCRFNDCLHLREPGCAVLAAVDAGEISARRYESYKRLLNIMRGLLPSHQRK
jgi:ribosome biogenesis GTPase